jgi:glyoxylase-like metal-dependent hydrolase (beta-lactamase superfamily II)
MHITLVRTPDETILIDVGAGPHYMPGAGKLADNMDRAGIDRKSVTKVVLTHAHPDHLWGLLDDFDDTPLFPNASYVMSSAEFEFWMAEDVAARLPEDRRNFAPTARRNLTSITGSSCRARSQCSNARPKFLAKLEETTRGRMVD